MAMKLENISLQDILDYIEKGSPDNAPEEIIRYLDLLDKVRGMYIRVEKYGTKEIIIKHLMKVENLSRYLANQIYNDSMEYFYSSAEISNAAWRNIYAEKLDNLATIAMMAAKDTKDFRQAAAIYLDAYKARGLDQPDAMDDDYVFQAPFKLYAMDASLLGMPTLNRVKVAEMIDNLPELTEKEKMMVKREAFVLPMKLFPDEQEDARKH